MADIIEEAPTGRSRCRECRTEIEEGDLRFASETSGLYGDSDSFAYYHLKCASRRFPERLLAALKKTKKREVDDYDALVAACTTNAKKSQSKFPYGERAPTGRARCIHCNEPIEKGAFRVAVEREIQTGAFTRMGAAYLHPKCAPTELSEAELAALAGNSPALPAADAKALAAEVGAAGPAQPASKPRTPRTQGTPPAPRVDQGAELVLADSLMDAGDPRGELIALASQLAWMTPADPRWAKAHARATEIHDAASAAWKKQLKKTPFELDRGLPALVLELKAKPTLPDEPWLLALHVRGKRVAGKAVGSANALAALTQVPAFQRVRRLVLERTALGWDTVRGFCSCDEVKNLESLELSLGLGPRAVLLVLSAPKLERLTELTVSLQYTVDPDARGFESATGLPSLRRLVLRGGVTSEVVQHLLRSPLAQRLESLETNVATLDGAALPKLRELSLEGWVARKSVESVVTTAGFGGLEFLDLRGIAAPPSTLNALARPKTLPSLRALAIREALPDVQRSLRKRFGDALIVGGDQGR